MEKALQALQIMQETAKKLAANNAALLPSANIMDERYVAERKTVMDKALLELACLIWGMEEAIILSSILGRDVS